MSSPPFFLRDSRLSETRARVKITSREKRRHAAGREKNEGLQLIFLSRRRAREKSRLEQSASSPRLADIKCAPEYFTS